MGNDTRRERVSRHTWVVTALGAIATGGVGAVSVEGLARELGVTKGSFYWHFENRSDLVTAALEFWERAATHDLIERLDEIADPAQRLLALFDDSFGEVIDGPIDALIITHADDPAIAPIVERVTSSRLAFLRRAFRELGLSRSRAAARARLTYAAYLGYAQLISGAAGGITPAEDRAFRRELAVLLSVSEP